MKFFKNKIKDLVVQNFIERVCIDFELELERTPIELGENPLRYREKTMSSFLFPALQNNSVRSLMEVYYNNGSKNFLDFYSMDKTRKCSYLIEFKHIFWGSNQIEFQKHDLSKWEKLNNQLDKLEKTSINEYIDNDNDKTIYGISFCMLTIIAQTESENNKIEAKIKSQIKKHMPDCDWGWMYELPKILNYTENNEEVDKYSHVVFLGKVKKLDEE
ncbi:MAG: hypothetical protein ACRC0G_09775 [Fusobacteriaceae bacterium]